MRKIAVQQVCRYALAQGKGLQATAARKRTHQQQVVQCCNSTLMVFVDTPSLLPLAPNQGPNQGHCYHHHHHQEQERVEEVCCSWMLVCVRATVLLSVVMVAGLTCKVMIV